MAKNSKGPSLFNLFKFSAVSGAGTFFGLLPQMIIGFIIFVIGLTIQKSYGKIAGLPFVVLGAIMMFQTGFAMSAVTNAIGN